MRVFVAGASGVIGLRLLPLLAERGHEVAGMTRTPAKAEALQRLGALPVVCDVFDRPALGEAVVDFAPMQSSASSPICRMTVGSCRTSPRPTPGCAAKARATCWTRRL